MIMKSRAINLLLALGAALLAGCNTVPPTNVHQPMTARPAQRTENRYANWRHLQCGDHTALFEDRRARFVGDTLTITIAENTSASTKSNSKATRTSAVDASDCRR
jgi:flagellar L-ring protein precursor FlgH